VYLATVSDGSQVAVKVIHPHVKAQIASDLRLLRFATSALDKIPLLHMEWFALPEAVEEFAVIMEEQLDMRKEAANLDKFRRQYKQYSSSVDFPKPFHHLTTENVLTETFEQGDPISEYFSSSAEKKRILAKPLITTFLRMVFTNNFIHCDLHPGNILVTKDHKLVFLDAGITNTLSDNDQTNLRDLFKAVVLNQGYEAGKMIVDRAKRQSCSDPEGFAIKIGQIVSEFHEQRSVGLTLGAVKIGNLMSRVLELCRSHKVLLEPAMANVVLSTIVLEGVGRTLDPDMNLFAAAMPFLLGTS